MRITRILTIILLTGLAVHLAWLSTGANAAAIGQDYVIAKGFVAAKNDTSLTLLENNRRVVVTVSNNTRILGQRDTFAAIVPNDVVRVEGRMVGNRLVADRVEVVLAVGSLRGEPQKKGQTTDVFTIDILPQ